MPLLDHFHPPLSEVRHWESLHGRWAATITDALEFDLLPPGYFAEMQSHVGSRVEFDVGTFEHRGMTTAVRGDVAEAGGVATLSARPWAPPVADLEMPAVFPDSIEVLVYGSEGGPQLVAAIELVSPGNKDRPESRRAFAAKCAAYLQTGVAVMIVDVVTDRQANLHNELIALMDVGPQFRLPDSPTYATSYRPSHRAEADRIQVWTGDISVGEMLPVLPLPLNRGIFVRLDLEATYQSVTNRTRLP